ncbi:Phage tail assembly [Lactococcus lactis subsp. lactis]|uniref:Phage tail assembly n=1 Tax=Lactococcus lactis subsp. lactis TaxID=1360 RepID=A0A0V8CY15_LACLL|nr:Phage tail assembly [Lactococcus lactis subsp. lactis]
MTDSKNKFNWLSVEGKHYNSDGQLEFYKNAGDNTAYAPLSRDMFPSQLKSSSSDRYTRKNLSIEATSANSLWDYAVSQFKLYAYPQMTYEVSVAVNAVTSALGNDRKLDIGDTIIVQDKTFDKSEGGLILSARVSEQEISFTNPHNNKITFTNFVRLKSEISADLYGRMKDLVDQNIPYKAEVETTNGLQFKNGKGSTTLTARIYFGSDSTETKADSYEWRKDGTLVANVQEITVDASEIDGKAVYAYKATVNEKVVGTTSVTITNVNDGENGTDGTDGRSVTGIEQKYQLTQTSEKPVDPWGNSVWLPSIPKMTATNKYLWSITRTTFNQTPLTQDVVEQKAIYGDSGQPGSDGSPGKVVSDTEPTTKFKGLTWKYSGVVDMTLGNDTKILAGTEYYWNGTAWALYEINAHNINGDNLSVTNGTFKDGKIESIWGGNGVNGTTTIEGSHLQIHSSDSTTNTENTVALDNLQGYAQVYTDHNTGRTITVQASFQGFFVSDSTGPYVRLTPQGLIQTSKKATVNFGYGRNVTLTRNGSYVTITSQNRYTIKPANNTWIRNVATLPLGYRPVEDVLIYNHDLGNSSKFSWSLLHPSGVIDLFSSGDITTTDYILSSSQIWITTDELPS